MQGNACVETMLPRSVPRKLGEAAMNAYWQPFMAAGGAAGLGRDWLASAE